jgi:hypothetical protein
MLVIIVRFCGSSDELIICGISCLMIDPHSFDLQIDSEAPEYLLTSAAVVVCHGGKQDGILQFCQFFLNQGQVCVCFNVHKKETGKAKYLCACMCGDGCW